MGFGGGGLTESKWLLLLRKIANLNDSLQRSTPHCLAAIFNSQLPSPILSLKMPPKERAFFVLFEDCPRGEGRCVAIKRQRWSRGNFASRHHFDASPGSSGSENSGTEAVTGTAPFCLKALKHKEDVFPKRNSPDRKPELLEV